MEMTEVIVGTYEEFLLGYKLTADKNGVSPFKCVLKYF